MSRIHNYAVCENPKCRWNETVDYDDRFCPTCGAKLLKKCPQCYYSIRKPGFHCMGCGRLFKPLLKSSAPQPSGQKRRSGSRGGKKTRLHLRQDGK